MQSSVSKRSRTTASGVLVLLVLGLLLVGATAAFAAPPSGKPVEINVWMGSWYEKQAPIIEKAFSAEYPNLSVKILPVPIDGYVEKASAAILAGSPPDVIDLDATFIPGFVHRNMLMNWDDYSKELTPGEFAAGIWQASVYNKHIYAVPNRGESSLVYFNKDMFDAAGVKYPTTDWTYADMLNIMLKISNPAEGRYGYGMTASSRDPANVMQELPPLVWAYGGEVMNDEGTKILLNEPKAVAAIQFWVDLLRKYKVAAPGSINYTSADQADLFLQNKVATVFQGTATADSLNKQTAVRWGVQLYPQKVNRGAGYAYAIPVGAPNVDAARTYVLWFCKAENLGKLAIRMPARLAATKVPPWNNEVYHMFSISGQYTRLVPAVTQWTSIQNIWIREMQRALQGEISVQQALDNVKRDGEAQLRP
jgi:multiple sugar transport system substrate-binding protein